MDGKRALVLRTSLNKKTVSGATKPQGMVWGLVYSLWLIHLIRPERLISYYLPGMTYLRMLPTVLLCLLCFLWLMSEPQKKYNFKGIALFLVVSLISAIFAYNTGRARIALRQLFELYLLSLITFSYVDTKLKTDSILKLYMFQFLYLSVWGITGKGVIKWDYILNEEDAYGPLMCIGVAYCSQYYESLAKGILKKTAMAVSALCVLGIIASFARGTFLSLVCIIGYLFVKSKNKAKGLAVLGTSVILIVVGASLFFPDNAYWNRIKTSTQGTSAGTGFSRKIYWSVAWEEFKNHPIIGVGPYNFGVLGPEYVGRMGEVGDYSEPGKIWGRAVHNAYFQILCEQGIIGALAFIILLIGFFKSNAFLIKRSRVTNGSTGLPLVGKNTDMVRDYYGVTTGIKVGMVGFLLNAFFYDIIYYNWFWNLLILNRLLYINAKKEEADRVG